MEIMFKKYTLYPLLAVLTTFSAHAAQTIYLPQGIALDEEIETIAVKKSAQELEFAFDIHKVVLQERLPEQIGTFWSYKNKLKVAGMLIHFPLMIELSKICWQQFSRELLWNRNNYKEITSEDFFTLLKRYGKDDLIDLVIQIINTQKVSPDVEKIIVELKQNGHILRIASNIGKQVYEKLKQQFEKNGTNVFAHFTLDKNGMEGKTIDFAVSSVQKPDLEYFKQYLETYNAVGKKLFIFIDDKLDNVKAANTLGFIGIHFLNASQLKEDLISLRVF
ncbi:hypothetical protein BH09DEP1_BH09DEP1_3580 [soil metagenome]